MTLRPAPARWFEVLTAHKDLPRAMEALSRTGAVELEARAGETGRLILPDLKDHLDAYGALSRRYRAYWPAAAAKAGGHGEHLGRMMAAACKRLRVWVDRAEPLIAEIEALAGGARDLAWLEEALVAAPDIPALETLVNAGPRLAVRLFRLKTGAPVGEVPALVLSKLWDAPAARYMLAVGRGSDVEDLDKTLAARKARQVPIPSWLAGSAANALSAIAERRQQMARRRKAREEALAALSAQLRIADALGDVAVVQWVTQHADKLQGSERLAWLTGWTSDADGAVLRRALDVIPARYVLRLGEAPAGHDAPMVLTNPEWVRAFEIFARMLGVPARHETDPSVILAVLVPVLFGFMFGDVGQGFVICTAGLVLGRRVPMLRMLVPGGIMAAGFGALFGSVFCREDVIRPLWLRPMDYPIEVLLAAVAIGAGVLAIGLLLDAVQMHWRSAAHRWWGSRAGLALAFAGLLATPFRVEGLLVAGLGALWFVLGATVMTERPGFGALARGLAECVEELLRLLVNTLSFARVGAFALAHAGLSVAIVEVAHATGPVFYWIVLAAGNVLILALEGLVVGIQTTRLMLFEFFIRFLTGGGREFRPLPPPERSQSPLTAHSESRP